MRRFNLNTGIIILLIIIILVAIGTGIVGYSLWNVPKAKELFPFLEISEAFPTKAIALFTGLATFGTLLLALATILTIKNNNEREAIRRKDELSKESRNREERLLNEIIEWAEDIRKSSSESIDPNEIIFDTPIEQMATQRGFYNLRLRYQAISVKSEYMEGISKKVFGNDLLSATEIVTQKLGEIIDILKDCLTNRRASQKEKNKEVETYKKSLDSYAEDLIREATKIKTKDIG